MGLQASQLPLGDFRPESMKAELGTLAVSVYGADAMPYAMIRLAGVDKAVNQKEGSDGAV